MTFNEIARALTLNNLTPDLSFDKVGIGLLVTLILSFQIFFTYAKYTEKDFYSRSFNISLALIPTITTCIIFAMQSNLVISLGMVGALSIVRYRTAIKSPLDLFFIFWAISVGIICGASQYVLAIIMSIILVTLLIILTKMNYFTKLQMLIIRCKKISDLESTEVSLKKVIPVQLKSKQVTPEFVEAIYEFTPKKDVDLITFLSSQKHIQDFHILSNS